MTTPAAQPWFPRAIWWSACLAAILAGAVPARALRADGQPLAAPEPIAAASTSARIAPGSAVRTGDAPIVPLPPFAPTVVERIAVIGASASDGFGVAIRSNDEQPMRTELVDARDVIRAAARSRDGLVAQYANMMFFRDPARVGNDEVTRALATQPTLVLGADFLFWYAYGSGRIGASPIRVEADRDALFEVGLAELDRIVDAKVPLVVGNLPDIRHAKATMLAPSQVPEPPTIERLNARLTEWANTRPTVRVLDVAAVERSSSSGLPIRIGAGEWDPTRDGRLMQRDRLHPAFPGLVALVERAMQCAIGPASCTERFDFTPSVVRSRILVPRSRWISAHASRTRRAHPRPASTASPAATS